MIEERLTGGNIEWPNKARMAVLVTFDYQAEVGAPTLPSGKINYAIHTERMYGGRHGIWRVLDILDKYGLKSTFFVSGVTAERYPESVRAMRDRGHDIAGHAYAHEELHLFSRAEEKEIIGKTIAAIEKVSGVRPQGWRSPKVLISENTLELLAEYGFVYNSDFLNEDLPYVLKVGGKEMVEIPYTFTTDDACLYSPIDYPYGIPRNVLGVWQDEFDVLYKESEKSPKMVIICMHPYLTGRPSRSKALDDFLGYIKNFKGLWFARGIDVANWWKEKGY